MTLPAFNSLDDTNIYLIMPLNVICSFMLAAAWLRYARIWVLWLQAARAGKVTQPVSSTRWFISAHTLLVIVGIAITLRTTLTRFLFQSVPDGTIPTNGTYTVLADPGTFFILYGALLGALLFCCFATWAMVGEMQNVLDSSKAN